MKLMQKIIWCIASFSSITLSAREVPRWASQIKEGLMQIKEGLGTAFEEASQRANDNFSSAQNRLSRVWSEASNTTREQFNRMADDAQRYWKLAKEQAEARNAQLENKLQQARTETQKKYDAAVQMVQNARKKIADLVTNASEQLPDYDEMMEKAHEEYQAASNLLNSARGQLQDFAERTKQGIINLYNTAQQQLAKTRSQMNQLKEDIEDNPNTVKAVEKAQETLSNLQSWERQVRNKLSQSMHQATEQAKKLYNDAAKDLEMVKNQVKRAFNSMRTMTEMQRSKAISQLRALQEEAQRRTNELLNHYRMMQDRSRA